MNVLIVEDDAKILKSLESGLTEAGYRVRSVQNGLEAYEIIINNAFDFLILDVALPGIDGLELLKRVRAKKNTTPAIFLSAKHTLSERLLGFDAGSDDYITKPFSLQELIARMEAIVRRANQLVEKLSELSYADLKMSLLNREVTRAGQKIRLQGREIVLLEYFLRNPEQILTKSMILKNVLEYHFEPQTNVVDVFVHRLRTKLEKGFDTKLIQTIRGVGYVLKT